jgi:hypothetical protein
MWKRAGMWWGEMVHPCDGMEQAVVVRSHVCWREDGCRVASKVRLHGCRVAGKVVAEPAALAGARVLEGASSPSGRQRDMHSIHR